jgi:ketosteroid isomerase-like protein
MKPSANVAVVRQIYAAFEAGDVAGALAHLADDVTWTYAAPEDIPWGGVFQGHPGVERCLQNLFRLAEVQAFVIDDFVAQGEKVVALGTERMRFKSTGRVWGTVWAHVYRLQAGKVQTFLGLLDSAAVRSGTNPAGAPIRTGVQRRGPTV